MRVIWIVIILLVVVAIVLAAFWGNGKRRQRVIREIGLVPLEERVVEQFLEITKFPDPATEERYIRSFGRYVKQAERDDVELAARGDQQAMRRLISAADEMENARIA